MPVNREKLRAFAEEAIATGTAYAGWYPDQLLELLSLLDQEEARAKKYLRLGAETGKALVRERKAREVAEARIRELEEALRRIAAKARATRGKDSGDELAVARIEEISRSVLAGSSGETG